MGVNSTLLHGAIQHIRSAVGALEGLLNSQGGRLYEIDYDLGKAIDRLERIAGELESRDE